MATSTHMFWFVLHVLYVASLLVHTTQLSLLTPSCLSLQAVAEVGVFEEVAQAEKASTHHVLLWMPHR